MRCQICTVFTKGQSRQRHLLRFLAMNIDHYSPLPKTSNLTPPELMRNPGKSPHDIAQNKFFYYYTNYTEEKKTSKSTHKRSPCDIRTGALMCVSTFNRLIDRLQKFYRAAV